MDWRKVAIGMAVFVMTVAAWLFLWPDPLTSVYHLHPTLSTEQGGVTVLTFQEDFSNIDFTKPTSVEFILKQNLPSVRMRYKDRLAYDVPYTLIVSDANGGEICHITKGGWTLDQTIRIQESTLSRFRRRIRLLFH